MKPQALGEEVELERESMGTVCKNDIPTPKEVGMEQERMEGLCKPSTIHDLLSTFLAFRAIGVTPRTVEKDREDLNYWLRFMDEQNIMELAGITPKILGRFQAWLLTYRSRYKKPLTLSSQVAALSVLRRFLHYLHDHDHLSRDLSAVIRLPRLPQILPVDLLSSADFEKLIHRVDLGTLSGFRDRTMIELLYSCGLRIGELLKLELRDLNLAEQLLFVRHAKGGTFRTVPVGQVACDYLHEYLKKVRPLLLLKENSVANVLFLNRHGQPFGSSGFFKEIRRYGRRAKLPYRLTVHTFRHTLATEMLKRGADLRHIQAMLGHQHLRTTQRYLHLVKDELKRVQQRCHPREQNPLPESVYSYRGLHAS